MNSFFGRILLTTLIIVYSANLAQDQDLGPSSSRYKTMTTCEFNDKFKIELHEFPDTGERGAKRHIVAYIKNEKSEKWLRTRIYLPPSPIKLSKKQRDLSSLRSPASAGLTDDEETEINVFYFKDDLQKPVKSNFPNIDPNSGLVAVIQKGVNDPVSMLVKGYFHHWGWGPHSTNEKWSTYEPVKMDLQSVLLQRNFYDMAFTSQCEKQYLEI